MTLKRPIRVLVLSGLVLCAAAGLLAQGGPPSWAFLSPTTAALAKHLGMTLEALLSRGYVRFNAPQPWKIDRDGKVTNAIYSI